MKLSEILGRLNYILQTEGDMEVVRWKDFRLGEAVSNQPNDFEELSHKNYFVMDDRTQKYLVVIP